MLVLGMPALFGLSDVAVIEGDLVRAVSLEELLRASDDGRVSVDKYGLYLRLGDILTQQGEESRLAVVYYQKACDGSWDVAQLAFAALEMMHTQSENWGDVARTLEMSLLQATMMTIALTDSAASLTSCPTDMAILIARLSLLELALASMPKHIDLLERLAGLYRRGERLASCLSSWALAEVEMNQSASKQFILSKPNC